jgi:hypothetical protein
VKTSCDPEKNIGNIAKENKNRGNDRGREEERVCIGACFSLK